MTYEQILDPKYRAWQAAVRTLFSQAVSKFGNAEKAELLLRFLLRDELAENVEWAINVATRRREVDQETAERMEAAYKDSSPFIDALEYLLSEGDAQSPNI